MAALLLARADLLRDRLAWRNRMDAPGAHAVRPLLAPVLDALGAQLAAADARLAELVGQDPELQAEARVLQSLKGIGKRTACALLALMPELGRIPNKQATALAGLAPHPKQSGRRDAYRPTRGGRPEVKRALFMPALVAAKHDPGLRGFSERLVANSKPKLKALTAVMRKLLVIANARLRDHLAAAHQVS